jgi:hypothetical protein
MTLESFAVTRHQYRIDHGLCPECGKEAAPYYRCDNHRQIGAIGRMLNHVAERGIVSSIAMPGTTP